MPPTRFLKLPFRPTIQPMLAKLSDTVPEGEGWLHEPKWDGFRAIVFKEGDDVELQSRDLKPLARYFPELVANLRTRLPERCIIDGEIVIATGEALDFETLLLRIHPAASRIDMLSKQAPASYVAWDLLALGDEDLRERKLAERRELLEKALTGVTPPVHLTPATRDRATAQDWFTRFEGAGLDGVVSKPLDGTYTPGKRTMVKTKHVRSADCVVAGYRLYKGRTDAVGSLVLGLFDDEGQLHSVGVTASFTMKKREELFKIMQPLVTDDHPWKEWMMPEEVRKPGMTSRWNRGKDLSWQPVRLEKVVEVKFDHMQGSRFRHATHFLRWRDDKAPRDCTYAQLEVTPPHELRAIFSPH
jgi:ATP-dependent DNA ligase